MKALIKLSIDYPRMTIRTLATLKVIKDNEGLTVLELSKIMGVGEKSVATTIRRLEEGKAGNFETRLIQFKPHQTDKRSRLIYLASAGRHLLRGV